MQKKPVISTPQIKSPSTTKMSYSFGNLIFLFLVAVGMFVVYRYVKSLENELKVVRKEMETLKKTEVKPIPQTNNVCSIDNNEPTCTMPPPSNTRKLEEIEEDLESVSSEDIMKIIEDIDSDEKQQVEQQQVDVIEEDDELVVEEEPSPPVQEDESEDEIEIQKVKTTDDDLMKKTNEELKTILKEHGKNIKGTKAELVKRITTEVYI